MSTWRRFDDFVSKIQLTDSQIEDAITKHTGVRKTLHNAYYSHTFVKSLPSYQELAIYQSKLREAYKTQSFDVLLDDEFKQRTSLLVGSYGKNTAIAPPSDIDILFEVPIEEFSRYDAYSSNGQSALLQAVKTVLQKTYPRTNVRADGQIVLVPFTTYDIEVLPAFRLKSGQYLFPDTNNGGSWRYTHPKAEMELLRDSNKRSNGNTIRLIKMLKAWKKWCSVPIKSLVLELRSVYFLEKWEHYEKSATYYDWMLRDFFQALLSYVNGSCKIPGIEETVYYGDAWESKAKNALAISQAACEYESSENFVLATIEWRKLFGDRFPY
jgi:hypothetical protein